MQNNQQHTNMEKLNLTVFPSILTALQELLTASLKKKKKTTVRKRWGSYSSQVSGHKHITLSQTIWYASEQI